MLQYSHLIPGCNAASKCWKRSSPESRKEAERKRRKRINSHLSTLRSLLPSSSSSSSSFTKTTKAMLLEEVVRHVRQMATKQADVSCLIAGDTNEPTVTCSCEEGGLGPGRNLIRVTLCCQDRPGLNRELGRAIRLVQVEAVRAEMATVGRLTRISMVLRWLGGVGDCEDEGVRALNITLRNVVENKMSGSGLDLDKLDPENKPVRVGSDREVLPKL